MGKLNCRAITQHVPVVVTNYVVISLIQEAFLHVFKFLMEPFTLSLTLMSQVFRKAVQMTKQVVDFYTHIGSNIAKL